MSGSDELSWADERKLAVSSLALGGIMRCIDEMQADLEFPKTPDDAAPKLSAIAEKLEKTERLLTHAVFCIEQIQDECDEQRQAVSSVAEQHAAHEATASA